VIGEEIDAWAGLKAAYEQLPAAQETVPKHSQQILISSVSSARDTRITFRHSGLLGGLRALHCAL